MGLFRRRDAADDNAADDATHHTTDHVADGAVNHAADGSAPSYDGVTDTDGQSEHPPPLPAKRSRRSVRLASLQEKAVHDRGREAQNGRAARKKADDMSTAEAAPTIHVQNGGQSSTVEDQPDAVSNVPPVATDTQHPVQAFPGHQRVVQPDAQQVERQKRAMEKPRQALKMKSAPPIRPDEGGRIGNVGVHGLMNMTVVEEVAMREPDFETSGEEEV